MSQTSIKEQFVKLVEDHKGIIMKVTKMYCEHRENREDLFQDIVIQLWQSFPKFQGNSRISTWMYKVALNTAITRIRKEKRKGRDHYLTEEVLQMPSSIDSDIEEKMNLMHKAIALLTDVEKAVVMLYMEDYSYKEMAEMLGTSESNIGFKINRVKGKLKDLVKTLSYGAGRI